jgi:hypothetical protein
MGEFQVSFCPGVWEGFWKDYLNDATIPVAK